MAHIVGMSMIVEPGERVVVRRVKDEDLIINRRNDGPQEPRTQARSAAQRLSWRASEATIAQEWERSRLRGKLSCLLLGEGANADSYGDGGLGHRGCAKL